MDYLKPSSGQYKAQPQPSLKKKQKSTTIIISKPDMGNQRRDNKSKQKQRQRQKSKQKYNKGNEQSFNDVVSKFKKLFDDKIKFINDQVNLQTDRVEGRDRVKDKKMYGTLDVSANDQKVKKVGSSINLGAKKNPAKQGFSELISDIQSKLNMHKKVKEPAENNFQLSIDKHINDKIQTKFDLLYKPRIYSQKQKDKINKSKSKDRSKQKYVNSSRAISATKKIEKIQAFESVDQNGNQKDKNGQYSQRELKTKEKKQQVGTKKAQSSVKGGNLSQGKYKQRLETYESENIKEANKKKKKKRSERQKQKKSKDKSRGLKKESKKEGQIRESRSGYLVKSKQKSKYIHSTVGNKTSINTITSQTKLKPAFQQKLIIKRGKDEKVPEYDINFKNQFRQVSSSSSASVQSQQQDSSILSDGQNHHKNQEEIHSQAKRENIEEMLGSVILYDINNEGQLKFSQQAKSNEASAESQYKSQSSDCQQWNHDNADCIVKYMQGFRDYLQYKRQLSLLKDFLSEQSSVIQRISVNNDKPNKAWKIKKFDQVIENEEQGDKKVFKKIEHALKQEQQKWLNFKNSLERIKKSDNFSEELDKIIMEAEENHLALKFMQITSNSQLPNNKIQRQLSFSAIDSGLKSKPEQTQIKIEKQMVNSQVRLVVNKNRAEFNQGEQSFSQSDFGSATIKTPIRTQGNQINININILESEIKIQPQANQKREKEREKEKEEKKQRLKQQQKQKQRERQKQKQRLRQKQMETQIQIQRQKQKKQRQQQITKLDMKKKQEQENMKEEKNKIGTRSMVKNKDKDGLQFEMFKQQFERSLKQLERTRQKRQKLNQEKQKLEREQKPNFKKLTIKIEDQAKKQEIFRTDIIKNSTRIQQLRQSSNPNQTHQPSTYPPLPPQPPPQHSQLQQKPTLKIETSTEPIIKPPKSKLSYDQAPLQIKKILGKNQHNQKSIGELSKQVSQKQLQLDLDLSQFMSSRAIDQSLVEGKEYSESGINRRVKIFQELRSPVSAKRNLGSKNVEEKIKVEEENLSKSKIKISLFGGSKQKKEQADKIYRSEGNMLNLQKSSQKTGNPHFILFKQKKKTNSNENMAIIENPSASKQKEQKEQDQQQQDANKQQILEKINDENKVVLEADKKNVRQNIHEQDQFMIFQPENKIDCIYEDGFGSNDRKKDFGDDKNKISRQKIIIEEAFQQEKQSSKSNSIINNLFLTQQVEEKQNTNHVPSPSPTPSPTHVTLQAFSAHSKNLLTKSEQQLQISQRLQNEFEAFWSKQKNDGLHKKQSQEEDNSQIYFKKSKPSQITIDSLQQFANNTLEYVISDFIADLLFSDEESNPYIGPNNEWIFNKIGNAVIEYFNKQGIEISQQNQLLDPNQSSEQNQFPFAHPQNVENAEDNTSASQHAQNYQGFEKIKVDLQFILDLSERLFQFIEKDVERYNDFMCRISKPLGAETLQLLKILRDTDEEDPQGNRNQVAKQLEQFFEQNFNQDMQQDYYIIPLQTIFQFEINPSQPSNTMQQFFNQAIFDMINTLLDSLRPFGSKGLPVVNFMHKYKTINKETGKISYNHPLIKSKYSFDYIRCEVINRIYQSLKFRLGLFQFDVGSDKIVQTSFQKLVTEYALELDQQWRHFNDGDFEVKHSIMIGLEDRILLQEIQEIFGVMQKREQNR